MSRANFDAILVGGGVMSCASAYYLLKYDPAFRVAIIERDPSYRYASTPLSDGNLRVQFNIRENILMSIYGLQVLETFAEEMTVGDYRPQTGFRREGNLFMFTHEHRSEAHQAVELQRELGGRVEWLEAADISRRYPLLNLRAVNGGTLGLDDGTMDPWAILNGYRKKAVELGAEYIEAEVVQLLQAGGRAAGVRLASGSDLAAPIVLNGAGAWAPRLARTAGIELPVQAVRRQVFVLETEISPQEPLPAFMFPSGLYCIHEHANFFMVGKSLDDDPVSDSDFSWDAKRFVECLWEELAAYIPAFDRLKVVRGWSGLYAVNTFDGNAILGEWPRLPGFLLANGFSGHGFQQCHAVGRYIAELILSRSHALDLSIFSPQRFLDGKPVFEGAGRIV